MSRPTVTIRLHSETVTAQQLVKAIENVTGIFGDIDRQITGHPQAMSQWLVEELKSSEPQHRSATNLSRMPETSVGYW